MYLVLILDACMYAGFRFMSRSCGIYYFVGSNIRGASQKKRDDVEKRC